MSNIKSTKTFYGDDPSDKEYYRIKIEFERNGYNGIGEKIPKQRNGPFKQYLNTLKKKNPRTKNWKVFGKIHGDNISQKLPFTPFSRDEAIYILENRDPKKIKIMFPHNLPITLEEMFTINNVVYNEVLKYIWKIHHMKVTVWINEKNKYTVNDSDIVVDENTQFSIDSQSVIIHDDNATVIDDEIDYEMGNEMKDDEKISGGKRHKTKSRKSKKSSPKRKRRTNRRR